MRALNSWLPCVMLAALLPLSSCVPSVSTGVKSSEIHAEHDGRRYRVERVPKVAGKYQFIDAETVRYFPFATYKIASQDDQYLYVKQYIVDARPARPAKPNSVAPIPPQIADTAHMSLREFDSGLPHTGQWRDDFAIADMDGDGQLDIVFGPPRKSFSGPAVYRGDGKGIWQRWAGLQFPSLPYDYGGVAVADFNGDGIPDLALGMHLRGVSVLLSDGKGKFTRYDQGLPLGVPGAAQPPTYSTHALAAVDWNSDGKPDLLTLDEGLLGSNKSGRDGAKVFVNNNGVWIPADFPVGEGPSPSANMAVVANLAGVNPQWLILSRSTDGADVVHMSAGNHWVRRILDDLPHGAIVRSVAAVASPRGAGSINLVVAYQLFVADAWHSAIDFFADEGDRFRRRPLHDEATRAQFLALGFGHLASPDSWDLVTLRNDGAMQIYADDGHGFLTRDYAVPIDAWRTGCAGTAVHLRDLDGDGVDEIVASFSGEPDALTLRRDCANGGGIEAWKVVPAQ
ncbi:MAG: VCBS repeat-containing protein [Dokdonella sp.]